MASGASEQFLELAILDESALVSAMPEWDSKVLKWEELCVLPMRWKSALSLAELLTTPADSNLSSTCEDFRDGRAVLRFRRDSKFRGRESRRARRESRGGTPESRIPRYRTRMRNYWAAPQDPLKGSPGSPGGPSATRGSHGADWVGRTTGPPHNTHLVFAEPCTRQRCRAHPGIDTPGGLSYSCRSAVSGSIRAARAAGT